MLIFTYTGKGGEVVQLTNKADKLICIIYKTLLERESKGLSESEANMFDHNFDKTTVDLFTWHNDDIHNKLSELSKNGLIKLYIDHGFRMTDEGILYMENRFRNGLKELIDIVSKSIP